MEVPLWFDAARHAPAGPGLPRPQRAPHLPGPRPLPHRRRHRPGAGPLAPLLHGMQLLQRIPGWWPPPGAPPSPPPGSPSRGPAAPGRALQLALQPVMRRSNAGSCPEVTASTHQGAGGGAQGVHHHLVREHHVHGARAEPAPPVPVPSSDKVVVGSTAVMPGKFLYNIATKTCEENTGKSVNPLVFQWQPTIASANFPLETLPNNFLRRESPRRRRTWPSTLALRERGGGAEVGAGTGGRRTPVPRTHRQPPPPGGWAPGGLVLKTKKVLHLRKCTVHRAQRGQCIACFLLVK